jgi:hypothetical protein
MIPQEDFYLEEAGGYPALKSLLLAATLVRFPSDRFTLR